MTRTILHVTAYAAALATAALFTFQAEALQPGTIKYVTGGVGSEERSALQATQRDYNFRLLSANTEGGLVGDTSIVIRDTKGNEILRTIAGPIFYAELPNGSYTLEANSDGQMKQKTFTVRQSKPTVMHLSWIGTNY